MEETDIYVYVGDVERDGHTKLTALINSRIQQKKLHQKVLFCIATYGGDPSAGYRMGRALQHHYKDISVLVLGPCKSAGTLMAVAAHKLIIGDLGELGPLDIQLKKNDEIGELSSGLVIFNAVEQLKESALSAFGTYIVNLKYKNQISTKMSADIAAKLTEALISPMASQIDPIKLGEHQRAMGIAISYGERLNKQAKNLKDESLRKLIAGYPAHGFVIDRKEARELFERVESPKEHTLVLYNILSDKIFNEGMPISGGPLVWDFTKIADDHDKSNEEDTNDSKPEKGDGGAEPDSGTTEPEGDKPRKGSVRKRENPKSPVGAVDEPKPADGSE